MCGIAGIIVEDVRGYRKNLRRMVDSLIHRGPDGSGTHFFNKCALGHTRLSIVDLETGHQPMLSALNSVGITFNGEIYGYKEIRALIRDYPFKTSSDTEVILALYHLHGSRLLKQLSGMFTFAIWDDSKHELLCARDRFGEKPFFYALGEKGEFIFASEIKALISSELIRPIISRKAVAHYLQHLYVHPYQTIYENIFTLPPAHLLTFKNGQIKVERYWELPETDDQIDVFNAVEQFNHLFEQSVKRQLIADVPVGAFLSGGLDSSTIVAVASKNVNHLRTYSFDFEDRSEVSFARAVSHQYQTEHTEMMDDEEDVGELLLRMKDVYDEPFADSSNIPTYLICKQASRYGKVIMTGDGGDELLAGYDFWYKNLFYMEQESKKNLLKLVIFRLLAHFSRKLQRRATGQYYKFKYGSVYNAHVAQNTYFTDDELSLLNVGSAGVSIRTDSQWQRTDSVDDALRMDLEDYLPGDILVKIDRASMSNGLELRAPFLDVDFASFCISLPSRLKIDDKSDKLILRQAYSSIWPEAIRSRNKQGFGGPVDRWLKLNSVRTLKEIYLNDRSKRIFELISFDGSRCFVEEDTYRTWILLVLSIWMEGNDYPLGTII